MSAPYTTTDMHRILRKRTYRGTRGWGAILGSDISPGRHTTKEMRAILRQKLSGQGDRGVVNLLKNWILEPRNPFEPTRRRLPKREVVSVGSLIAALLGAIAWFNFLRRS